MSLAVSVLMFTRYSKYYEAPRQMECIMTVCVPQGYIQYIQYIHRHTSLCELSYSQVIQTNQTWMLISSQFCLEGSRLIADL